MLGGKEDKIEESVFTVAPAVSGFISLEVQIKELLDLIDKTKEEIKEQKQMVEDTFANDTVYQEHDQKVREATRVRQQTKFELQKQPQVADLTAKIGENRTELKGLQNTLSELLLTYQKETGATSIETKDGQVLDIINTARVANHSSFEKK